MVQRVQTGIVVMKPGLSPRTGTHNTPPQTARPWEIVTWSDPREWKSSCAPRGILLDKPAWAQFTHEWTNPGGMAGYLPHIGSKLPLSGSEV